MKHVKNFTEFVNENKIIKTNEDNDDKKEFEFILTCIDPKGGGKRIEVDQYINKKAATKIKNMIDPKFEPKIIAKNKENKLNKNSFSDIVVNENQNWKSDEDIQKEFDDFSLQEIRFETRDMSTYSYNKNTYEADVIWEFPEGDENVGGGASETSEDFIYNLDTKTFKYVCDSWYPETTYLKMIEIIKSELKNKYDSDFEHLKDIAFIKLNK